MFKSLVVLGALVAGFVSGAKIPAVNVVYEKPGTQTDPCASAKDIQAAGATTLVIGWWDAQATPAVERSDTTLALWNTMAVSKNSADCISDLKTAGMASVSMGVQYSAWATADPTLLQTSATTATTKGFTSIYWDISGLTSCGDTDISYIAATINTATKADPKNTIPVYFTLPASYLGIDPASFCMNGNPTVTPGVPVPPVKKLQEALATVDAAKLAGVVVKYYASDVDFSLDVQMFTASLPGASGTAIPQLEAGMPNMAGKFIVGKLMHKSDNPDTTPFATDFVDLPTVAQEVCAGIQYDNYKNGVSLSSWTDGDKDAMTAAFSTDCSTVTTPSPVTTPVTTTTKASGAGSTVAVSAIALAAGLTAIMN